MLAGRELNVRLVESCHLLARLCGDKKVIIWGQGTHLLGMDRLTLLPAKRSPHTPALDISLFLHLDVPLMHLFLVCF